jgi:hypothetical protein
MRRRGYARIAQVCLVEITSHYCSSMSSRNYEPFRGGWSQFALFAQFACPGKKSRQAALTRFRLSCYPQHGGIRTILCCRDANARMLHMSPKSCIYCGDACDRTVPLDWAVPNAGEPGIECVRLNLCERCSHSWTAFADEFCPVALPERRSA